MGNSSDYVFGNWGNVASYTVISIAEYLKRPENIQGKAIFFILLSSMFMALYIKCT